MPSDRMPVICTPEVLSDGRAESAGQFDPSVVAAADVHAVRSCVPTGCGRAHWYRSQVVGGSGGWPQGCSTKQEHKPHDTSYAWFSHDDPVHHTAVFKYAERSRAHVRAADSRTAKSVSGYMQPKHIYSQRSL